MLLVCPAYILSANCHLILFNSTAEASIVFINKVIYILSVNKLIRCEPDWVQFDSEVYIAAAKAKPQHQFTCEKYWTLEKIDDKSK